MEMLEKSAAPEISVVIPAYNEEESLEVLNESIFNSIVPLGKSFEVIYVDDGSSDRTFEKIKEVCSKFPNVKGIKFRRNFGQTAAMSAGFDHADGRVIIAMDADLQNDPSDIKMLIDELDKGYDIVNGWRKDRKDTLFSRRMPSVIANWLIGRATGVKLHDYGCSLKAYRAEVIKNVPLYGQLHRFIPALAYIYGAKITEVPVKHHARAFGKSKYNLSRIYPVVMDMITVSFLKSFGDRPLHMFGKLSLLCLGLGIGMDGYLTILKIVKHVNIANRPLLLLGTLLILAGLQMFSTGILAEIQMRTYYESQRKPIYSIREIING
ncbi:MAG: glycosyltransferase family 2 protein [Firmicutes bacterium]|nr:glycosyltransferase family 2 protein [Bacillota bacterium]